MDDGSCGNGRVRWSLRRSGVWFVAISMFVAATGCSSESGTVKDESVATTGQALMVAEFSVRTLNGDVRSTFMSATNSLVFDARSHIGDGSEMEAVASFGTTQSEIGSNAVVKANVTSLAKVNVQVGADIAGFVRSASTIENSTALIRGGTFPNAEISSFPTSWTVTFPTANGGDVNMTSGTRVLAPGAWGNLNLTGTSRVDLQAGTYYFESFYTAPSARLYVNKTGGPVIIYVRTDFNYQGKLVSNGGPDTETLIGVFGSTAIVKAPLLGTIVAPNATIELQRTNDNTPHRGAAFGRGIHVDSDITILHSPFSFGFLCSSGDTDGDGVSDCVDQCPNDAAKQFPGLCNCGVSEADKDNDKIPDCLDACDDDPNNSVPGQCGCAGASPASAGTVCTDSPNPGTAVTTCNGAGVCGDPNSGAPAATGCTFKRFDKSYYWFCTGAVTWAQAAQNCRASSGRYLARISSRVENEFVANVVSTSSWIGANDQTTEGTWRWSQYTNNNADPFWLGTSAGSRVGGRYENWAGGEPLTANNCASVVGTGGARGEWFSEACTATRGYVCEQPITFATTVPPEPPTRTGGPNPKETAPCIPESEAFPGNPSAADVEAQIHACNDAFLPGGACEGQTTCSACIGAASVPTAPFAACPAFSPEEQAGCALTNTLETGCTPGVDCCTLTDTAVLSQTFDVSSGTFTYLDDVFRGTIQPSYASGLLVTTGGNLKGAAQVTLGGVNSNVITNMSGGWRTTFTLASAAPTVVSFDYNLTQTPNYENTEFSQVLVTLDGALRATSSNDFIDQVVGDGDGGANVTTFWQSVRMNLGTLAAGTHTLTIGAFNNRKDNTNESTTLLLDNAKVATVTDSCPATFQCGMVYPADCHICPDPNLKPGEPCDTVCPTAARRCGQPVPNCANTAKFGSDLCQQIEICSRPEATGNSDPTLGGGLLPDTYQPDQLFGAPTTTPTPVYFDDPACVSPPCAAGTKNRWCSYNVKLWEDTAIPGLMNPVPDKATPVDNDQGSSGSGLLTFAFDPNISLNYSLDPLPFGESNFGLDTSASLAASATFNLGPAKGTANIIDAKIALHADRCRISTAESHVKIFGKDFLVAAGFPVINQTVSGCDTAIEEYVKAAGRARKAYSDALELIKQYNQHKAAGTAFPADFCETLLTDPPADFLPAACAPGETVAVTINRFIQYYEDQVAQYLVPAQGILATKVLTHSPEPQAFQAPRPSRESKTLIAATFPIGPIPARLEVEAFAEYGVNGALTFALSPGALMASTGEKETLANVDAHVTPYALAGVSLFVGTGLGFNGFSVSAGAEGSITLARLSLDNYTGAGIAVQATPDGREFPADIKAAAVPGVADAKITLFPESGPKKYDFFLLYNYGSKILLQDILSGNIAGRIRIKIAFFSKTWRQVLLKFKGFGPVEIPLISGGDNAPAFSIDGNGWGSVQAPLPFVKLARLSSTEILPGVAVPLSKDSVEEFFYERQCQCVEDNDPCKNSGDCCNKPTSVCFADVDPGAPHPKYCTTCRVEKSSCNSTADCCEGVNKFCDIMPPDIGGPGTPPEPTPLYPVCRRCHGFGESCTTQDDCCDKMALCASGKCEYSMP